MRIAVLGSGSWGTTLATLLANKSHDVSLWAYLSDEAERIRATRENTAYLPGIRIPDSVRVTASLSGSVDVAALLVAAVPSQYLRSVLTQLGSALSPGVRVVNVAKGIEIGTLMTMSEVIQDVLPAVAPEQTCTLSGPSHAEEVSRNIPTTVVAASPSEETARIVQTTFMVPAFRVYASKDVKGVELGGSLKNVIAIASGIIEGLNLGDNTRAALMTRGIAEITRMGVALGSDPRTFGGLSGIGDLMVTCMSRHSRNRHVGVQIGRGRSLSEILAEMVMVAEGVATTKSALELARKTDVEVPIITEVHNILFENKDPLRATYDLMTRDPKGEL